jgi:hypothetical protein
MHQVVGPSFHLFLPALAPSSNSNLFEKKYLADFPPVIIPPWFLLLLLLSAAKEYTKEGYDCTIQL